MVTSPWVALSSVTVFDALLDEYLECGGQITDGDPYDCGLRIIRKKRSPNLRPQFRGLPEHDYEYEYEHEYACPEPVEGSTTGTTACYTST